MRYAASLDLVEITRLTLYRFYTNSRHEKFATSVFAGQSWFMVWLMLVVVRTLTSVVEYLRNEVTMDRPSVDRRLLSIKSAADRLDVGRTTIYELIKRQELRKVNIGRRGLITSDSIDAYIERLTASSGRLPCAGTAARIAGGADVLARTGARLPDGDR